MNWQKIKGLFTFVVIVIDSLWRKIRCLWLRKKFGQSHGLPENTFLVLVNYFLTIEQMAEALRNKSSYLCRQEILNERFPISGNGIVVAELETIQFHRAVSLEDIDRYLIIHQLQPAGIEHLLAFGQLHPDEQLKYPIVAPAARYTFPCGQKHTIIPCLYHLSPKQHALYIISYLNDLNENIRFLVVRNQWRVG